MDKPPVDYTLYTTGIMINTPSSLYPGNKKIAKGQLLLLDGSVHILLNVIYCAVYQTNGHIRKKQTHGAVG